jgi:DNA-binding transcriptional MerR regulator
LLHARHCATNFAPAQDRIFENLAPHVTSGLTLSSLEEAEMMSTGTSTLGWKVGELAKRTGLTVRTLHHYEEIGLLPPSERTQKGHRLYGPADVERLQKIVGMRQLGFSLEEIRRALDDGATLDLVLDKQIQHMRQRIEMEQELCRRLEAARRLLRSTGKVSVDALIDAVELTMKIESHYSPEQLEYLKRRRAELGEHRIKEVEAEWPKLIAAVRAEMEKGTDPSSETMKKLAAQWAGLIREFTGGNEGVRQAASNAFASQIDQPGGFQGIDRELAEYVGRAIKAVKE